MAIAKVLEVGSGPTVTPKQLILSYPDIHNNFSCVSSRVSTPHAANRIFCFDSLQENNTLQKLVLIQCGIGDVGVAALAEGLKVGFQFIHRRCILKIATHMLAHTFGAFGPRLAPPLTMSFRSISDRKTPPSKSLTCVCVISAMWELRPSQRCSR